MKKIETSNLRVTYDWEVPCLDVYNDGTKVKLDAGKKKGKIIIEYSNNDDLERILDLLD